MISGHIKVSEALPWVPPWLQICNSQYWLYTSIWLRQSSFYPTAKGIYDNFPKWLLLYFELREKVFPGTKPSFPMSPLVPPEPHPLPTPTHPISLWKIFPFLPNYESSAKIAKIATGILWELWSTSVFFFPTEKKTYRQLHIDMYFYILQLFSNLISKL